MFDINAIPSWAAFMPINLILWVSMRYSYLRDDQGVLYNDKRLYRTTLDLVHNVHSAQVKYRPSNVRLKHIC